MQNFSWGSLFGETKGFFFWLQDKCFEESRYEIQEKRKPAEKIQNTSYLVKLSPHAIIYAKKSRGVFLTTAFLISRMLLG